MNPIEALALAIGNLNEAFTNPESQAFQCGNPGLLPARTLESLGTATDDGIRRFTMLQGGLKALVDALAKEAKWHPHRTISQVLNAYGHGSEFEIREALAFVSMALGRILKPDTNLKSLTEQ